MLELQVYTGKKLEMPIKGIILKLSYN